MTLGSCKTMESGRSINFEPPVAAMSEQGIHLPLKISWISNLFNEDDQDTFRPVENSSPTIDGDFIFVGSHYGFIYCLEKNKGTVIWKFKAYGGIEAAPVVYNDLVIFGDSDGNIYCLRKNDGYARWTYKVQGEVMGRIKVHENVALFTTSYNRIYALNAQDGSWIWTHQRALPEGFSVRGVSTPVTDGKLVYAGLADGYIVAVDMDRGKEIWKNYLQIDKEQFLDVDATPVIDGDRILIPSYGGGLYCLSREDGSVIWRYGKGGISKVELKAGRVYLGNSDGYVICLNAETGKMLWEFDVRENDAIKSATAKFRARLRVPSAPVILGEYVFTASSSGYLYALDIDTGRLAWKYNPGFGISSALVKSGQDLYFVSNSAMLFKMQPTRYPKPLI